MITIAPWGHEYTIPIWAAVALYLFVGFVVGVIAERTRSVDKGNGFYLVFVWPLGLFVVVLFVLSELVTWFAQIGVSDDA